MDKLNKQQTINELDKLIEVYGNEARKNATYVERLTTLKRIISKQMANEKTLYSVYNKQGHINLGLLIEGLALDYLGLEREDENHEVKSFVLNSWNTLTNDSVEWVYVVVVGNSRKIENGFYKVSANDIKGKRGNLEVLRNAESLERVCSLSQLVRG